MTSDTVSRFIIKKGPDTVSRFIIKKGPDTDNDVFCDGKHIGNLANHNNEVYLQLIVDYIPINGLRYLDSLVKFSIK